ncbi:hypothetical protein VPH35_125705 [Triticum aestivum]
MRQCEARRPSPVAHANPPRLVIVSVRQTGQTIAIRKVLQDKQYKNRELRTKHLHDHPNVVALKHCFFSTTEKDEILLNLVLEYVYRITALPP